MLTCLIHPVIHGPPELRQIETRTAQKPIVSSAVIWNPSKYCVLSGTALAQSTGGLGQFDRSSTSLEGALQTCSAGHARQLHRLYGARANGIAEDSLVY